MTATKIVNYKKLKIQGGKQSHPSTKIRNGVGVIM